MFSILADDFRRSEIKTLSELFEIITNSSVNPKPSCESLWWTWDWKQYIEDQLSDQELQNHSFYNCFQIVKENGHTRLRAKPLPQDKNWSPTTGIRLVKDSASFSAPIPVADFRIEKLDLPKVYRDLLKYVKRMPLDLKIRVTSEWESHIEKLEHLPLQQASLPSMHLDSLPVQSQLTDVHLPDEYQFVEEEEVPPLHGEIYQEEARENIFQNYVMSGMDVVVYTACTEDRPWCGRVLEVLLEGQFKIHWFARSGKGNKYRALMNRDGSAYTSVLSTSVVMYWEICEAKQKDSFIMSPTWLKKVMEEYARYDSNFQ